MSWFASTTGLSVLMGALIGAGVWAVVAGLTPRPVRLSDALGRLSGTTVVDAAPLPTRGSERLGVWASRVVPVPLTARQRQLLALRGRSIAEFYADKVVLGLVGLATPLVVGAAFALLVGSGWVAPVAVSVVVGIAGYFWPDYVLHKEGEQTRSDASEALYTYVDLVILERLGNASATQSLHSAASVSDTVLFRQIRAALERARLEQRPPYDELRRLAAELSVPELTDLADVMSLDDVGASLSGTLRARVAELRDAQLTRHKIAAHEVSERMTIWMVLPALVFALIFLAPPLLRLLGSG